MSIYLFSTKQKQGHFGMIELYGDLVFRIKLLEIELHFGLNRNISKNISFLNVNRPFHSCG